MAELLKAPLTARRRDLMARLSLALALLTSSALAGCGSHNHAPVVYGTAPLGSSARIYDSPGHPAPVYGGGVAPAVATAGLAPLTPVTENWREGRVDDDSRPVLLAAASPAEETLPGQVTVLPGDTVYAIARRTGASPQAIIALNRMDPPYTLRVGEIIRVPSNAIPPSRAARATAAAHVVRPGDTLYSISRATGVGVADLARANRLKAPYALNVGQTLAIPGAASTSLAASPIPATGDVADIARNVSYGAEPEKPKTMFDWPVQGAIIGTFGLSSAGKRNDGVNIAAPVGTPVRAAADGEVVYRGSELEGYGNLLLVKHTDGFVTAYAHNDAMLVKKGDRVKKGQVIAKVGQTGAASEPQLHFEVRQNLKAIDPIALLGSL
jgi:murein DD-endopeptidase MepM/ murein hydrolase activator NlpD